MKTECKEAITIIDGLCGSGKSTYMLNWVTEQPPSTKIIWVTPFLDEISRVLNHVNSSRKFVEFLEPEKVMGKKFDGFKRLVDNGVNIVCTHSIFGMLDQDTIQSIKLSGYVLIIDEALDVLEQRAVFKQDVEAMLEKKIISISPEGYVEWTGDAIGYSEEGDHSRHKDFIVKNRVKLYDNTLVKVFPIESLTAFKRVFILTFLWEGQWMKLWMDMHGVQYQMKSIDQDAQGNYIMIEYKKPNVNEIKPLVNIYEGKMNEVGKGDASGNDIFTYSRLKSLNANNGKIKQAQKHLENWFKNTVKAKQSEIIWTTSLEAEKHFRTVFTRPKRFVVWNKRSTNEYRDTHKLAYLLNKHASPSLVQFFRSQGVEVDQRFMELHSLSNIIQWVWRSRIRQGKSIDLFIPSERSRRLLKQFLEGEL